MYAIFVQPFSVKKRQTEQKAANDFQNKVDTVKYQINKSIYFIYMAPFIQACVVQSALLLVD